MHCAHIEMQYARYEMNCAHNDIHYAQNKMDFAHSCGRGEEKLWITYIAIYMCHCDI